MNRTPKTAMILYAAMLYAFLYAPIIVLVLFSFNDSKLDPAWHGFTLRWYESAFRDIRTMEALMNSIRVALVSTALSTILGTAAAIGLEKHGFRAKPAMDGLIYMPIVIPETVMGISLLAFFVIMGIPLGLTTVVIAHVAFSLPFVTIVVRARLAGLDRRLEEAAMDLGAGEMQTLFRVTIPLAMPGILSGALMALTLSLDDFIVTFFTAGPGATTLPLRVFSMVKLGVTPEINAVSTVLMAFTIGVMVLTGGYRGHVGASGHTNENGETGVRL